MTASGNSGQVVAGGHPQLQNALVINNVSSRCGHCGHACDPREKEHTKILGYPDAPMTGKPGCGVRWTRVTSDYAGSQIQQAIQDMRPDLEWFEQFPKRGPSSSS